MSNAQLWWGVARIVSVRPGDFSSAKDYSTIGAIRQFGSQFVAYHFPEFYYDWTKHGFR